MSIFRPRVSFETEPLSMPPFVMAAPLQFDPMIVLKSETVKVNGLKEVRTVFGLFTSLRWLAGCSDGLLTSDEISLDSTIDVLRAQIRRHSHAAPEAAAPYPHGSSGRPLPCRRSCFSRVFHLVTTPAVYFCVCNRGISGLMGWIMIAYLSSPGRGWSDTSECGGE